MKPTTITIVLLLIIIALLIGSSVMLQTIDELKSHIRILESNLHTLHKDMQDNKGKPPLIINNREHRGY